MLTRRLPGLLLLLFLSGCHAPPGTRVVDKMPYHASQTVPLSSFDAVSINAPVNVTLHTGSHRAQVTLQGDTRDLAVIHTEVRQGVLYISLENKRPHIHKPHLYYGPVNIDIQTQVLHGLTYRGKGMVTGRGLQTRQFDVWIKNPDKTLLDGQIDLHKITVVGKGYTQISGINTQNLEVKLAGNPKVQLTGIAGMTSLDIKSDAMFSFYWLKSNRLIVKARKSALIQLAGVAADLEVELWGNARFNGRYLRATRVFVKTHDHALAELATVSRQHTLAQDASDIYFYNLPTYRTDFMGQNGAVLDMRDWEIRMEEEYTHYNK